MKERPILFSGPMVRAILDDKKTQTRRVMKPQPISDVFECRCGAAKCGDGEYHVKSPYGVPGDKLWVREAFAIESSVDDNKPPHNDGRSIRRWPDEIYGPGWNQPHYAATDPVPDLECEHESHQGGPCPHPWKPSIFMPRWASRITLEITDVRVQRVQEISEEDALAEGMLSYLGGVAHSAMPPKYRQTFRELWDKLNLKRGFGWDVNPWVWAITFRRVESK